MTDVILIFSKQNEQLRKKEAEKSRMQKELKKKQELEKAKLDEEKKKVSNVVLLKFILKYYYCWIYFFNKFFIIPGGSS